MISWRNRKLRISLRKDRAIFLICTLIALVFWFFVKLSNKYRSSWDIELHFILPADKALVRQPPANITATFEGTGWDLLSFSLYREKGPLVFDLNNLKDTSLSRQLVLDRVQTQLAGANLEVKSIQTEAINISLDEKVSKKVPIRLSVGMQFVTDHHLRDEPVLEPDSVTLTGPESEIKALADWPTDSILIGPLKTDWTGEVGMLRSPSGVLGFSPARVKLTIPVEPLVEKQFLFVPVRIKNAPDSLQIFPASVTVNCVLGMSDYNVVDADDFVIEADLKDVVLNSATNTVPLVLDSYPSAVRSIRYAPLAAEFFFQVRDDSTNLNQNTHSPPRE